MKRIIYLCKSCGGREIIERTSLIQELDLNFGCIKIVSDTPSFHCLKCNQSYQSVDDLDTKEVDVEYRCPKCNDNTILLIKGDFSQLNINTGCLDHKHPLDDNPIYCVNCGNKFKSLKELNADTNTRIELKPVIPLSL